MKQLYNKARNDQWEPQDVCMSIITRYGTGGGNIPIVMENVKMASYAFQAIVEYKESDKASALKMRDYKDATDLITQTTYGYDSYNQATSEEVSQTLKSQKGGDDTPRVLTSIVRRLTPRECELLQGMPKDWSRYGVNENGEVYELSDSARYRLQGNGIATPFWRYLMKRISAQYERTPTLGSLFDGQGSFPMIWEGINGAGTALWSSEIEKHAIAVAKYHFPEEGGEDAENKV